MLYADDAFVLVSKPENFVPSLLNLINAFGNLSGCKNNWKKLEILGISKQAHRGIDDNWNIKRNPNELNI